MRVPIGMPAQRPTPNRFPLNVFESKLSSRGEVMITFDLRRNLSGVAKGESDEMSAESRKNIRKWCETIMNPEPYTESRSAEELAKDAEDKKRFDRLLMAQTKARARMEQTKIDVKVAAVNALPEKLRAAAIEGSSCIASSLHWYALSSCYM
jgi:hypothetical protein